MTCQCSIAALECMPRPGVAELCCFDRPSCCDSVTIADFDAAVLEQFDLDGTLGDDPVLPAAFTVAQAAAFLSKHRRAIDATVEALAEHVCFARYVAGCTYKATFCVDSCACTPCDCRGGCYSCARTMYRLDMPECFASDRVAAVELDGVDVLNQPTGTSVEYHGGRWRIYDPPTGVRELCFRMTAAPTAAWSEAVLSVACGRVPCIHARGCNDESERNYHLTRKQLGLFGDVYADDLVAECCAPACSIGGFERIVRHAGWDTTITADPVDPEPCPGCCDCEPQDLMLTADGSLILSGDPTPDPIPLPDGGISTVCDAFGNTRVL